MRNYFKYVCVLCLVKYSMNQWYFTVRVYEMNTHIYLKFRVVPVYIDKDIIILAQLTFCVWILIEPSYSRASAVSETAYITYTVCNAATAQVIQRPSRGRYRVAHSPWRAAPLRWMWLLRLPPCISPSQLHGDASCCRRARECITSRRARTSSRVDGSRFCLALSNDPPLSCHSAPLSDPLSLPLFPAVIPCSFPTHLTRSPSSTPVVDHCPHPGGHPVA